MVKLSIIIPVYNVERYLRAGLDSVMREWREGVEVIAINDGSLDGSLTILREYESKYGFLHVIDQVNAGVSAARNAGMDVAQGEWVTFFDPDDSYVEGTLAYLLDACGKSDSDVITFNSVDVSDQNEAVPFNPGLVRRYNLNKICDVLFAVKSIYLTACNSCYRVSSIFNHRFVAGLAKSQDAVFGFGVMCRIQKIQFHQTILYKYFQRNDSCVHTVSEKRVRGCIDASAYMFEEARKWRWYDLCKKVIFRKVRVASIGEAVGLIREFPKEKQAELWAFFFDRLETAFAKDGYVPLMSWIWYRLAFGLKSPFLVIWTLHWPYRIARAMLKNEVLKLVWKKVR